MLPSPPQVCSGPQWSYEREVWGGLDGQGGTEQPPSPRRRQPTRRQRPASEVTAPAAVSPTLPLHFCPAACVCKAGHSPMASPVDGSCGADKCSWLNSDSTVGAGNIQSHTLVGSPHCMITRAHSVTQAPHCWLLSHSHHMHFPVCAHINKGHECQPSPNNKPHRESRKNVHRSSFHS